MAWSTGAITDTSPAAALSEILKTVVGGVGVQNWSFVGNVTAGTIIDEKQTITLTDWGAGDTFRITLDGDETVDIAYASDISTVLGAALFALPYFSADTSAQGRWFTVSRTSASVYVITFGGIQCTGDDIPLMSVTNAVGCSGSVATTTTAEMKSNAAAYNVDVFKCAGSGDDANDAGHDFYLYIGRYDVNEIVQITFTSFDAGDHIHLTYNTHETAQIDYSDDISAAIVTALEDLADFEVGDIGCTKISTSIYRVEFKGTKEHTDVTALTVTNGTGSATGSVAVIVTGANSTSLIWVGGSEDYSGGKFGNPCWMGYDTVTLDIDENDHIQYSSQGYLAGRYYPMSYIYSNCATWRPVLNSTGFTYQIKLHKNFISMATRVGTTEQWMFFGLLDSMVNPEVATDTLPLLFTATIGNPSYSNTSFSNLPGVGPRDVTDCLGRANLNAWLYYFITSLSNAANAQDKWLGGNIPVSRLAAYHYLDTAADKTYVGCYRGLFPSDFMCFYVGGTVVLGDTLTIDDGATPSTWTVMGKSTNTTYYVATKAE